MKNKSHPTMRAVAIDEFGGIEKMKPRQLPVPMVAADEILIRVIQPGSAYGIRLNARADSLKSSAYSPTFLLCWGRMALELWKTPARMFIISNPAIGFTVLTS